MEVLDKKRTAELERRMKAESEQPQKKEKDSEDHGDTQTTAHVSFEK